MKKSLLALAVVLLSLGACNTPGEETKDEKTATADNGQAAIENIMTRTSIRQY